MINKDIEFNKIKNIYYKILPYIVKTPLINNSTEMKDFFNTNLFFKLEFLQKTGCFKARGAINNLLNLSENQKKIGITTVSAGNHAIAASFAANKFKVKSKIFMYKSANKFRIKQVKSFSDKIIFTDPVNAFKDVEKASFQDGYYFLHPFDGKYTIQGTASLGYEICNQINSIDNAVISVGGGGLIAGVGSMIKQKFPKCKIIGVEPKRSNGMSESLQNGKPLSNVNICSIADSLSPPLHMPYSFSICQNIIDKIVTVSDKEIINSMKFMYEKYKLLLEPACVAGVAALLGPLKNKFKNQNTLLVLCGSNIDVKKWIDLIKN